jgi:DNA-binding beta-propeller fold protein YncE
LAFKSGFLFSLVSLPSLLLAQPGSPAISPPVLGFVFDARAHAVQPILGIPGASVLGAPLAFPFAIVDAAISPRQDYILVLTGQDHALRLLRPAQAGVLIRSIDGVMQGADRVFISPAGSALAIYHIADGLIQVVTGVPDSPTVQQELRRANPGDVFRSVAISDDGAAVLAAGSETGSLSLTIFGRDGVARQLPTSGSISAMAFRSQTHDALIADPQTHQVSLLRNATEAAEFQVVGGIKDGVFAPVAVEFASDGLTAFVANSETGNVAILDLTGGPARSISCDCRPTGLYRLSGDSLFRLNDPSGGPMLLLDGSDGQPRMFFVPSPGKDQ